MHCSLCLEYILITKHGGCPIFNCLHARLLLSLVCQEEITNSSGLSFVFLLLLLSNIQERTDCQDSCIVLNVLLQDKCMGGDRYTGNDPETVCLKTLVNDDFTLFSM